MLQQKQKVGDLTRSGPRPGELKYKEKTEMRENPKNPSLTCDLQCISTFLTKKLK